MTQKKALKIILEESKAPRISKIMFISDWLEDINWHTEHGILNQLISESERKMIRQLRNEDDLPFMLKPSFIGYQELKKTYPGFIAIFGYGISFDWNNVLGEKFIKEVMELI